MSSISDQVKEKVEVAVERCFQGDDFTWDVGSILNPANGQLVHYIYIFGKSPIIGQHIQSGGLLMDASAVTTEQVEEVVEKACEDIRLERSKQLSTDAPIDVNAELVLP